MNNSDRPIPRGEAAPRMVLVFSFALFAIASVLAFMLPMLASAIPVVNLVVPGIYTSFFEELTGVDNVLAPYLGGSTFLFSGPAVGKLSNPVIVLFPLATLSTFARESSGVLRISRGTAKKRKPEHTAYHDRETTSARNGPTVFLVAVVASLGPYVHGTFGVASLVIGAPAIIVTLYARYPSDTDPTGSQSFPKKRCTSLRRSFSGVSRSCCE
ncbi:UbiA family prenyltransferase [Haladaptatus pallidirubidus]|uniref:UbiA family prenyltransferase n=1 Tax=Haladaptatus pallidirubidus TaxID=1008152 RepID=UPI0035E7168D